MIQANEKGGDCVRSVRCEFCGHRFKVTEREIVGYRFEVPKDRGFRKKYSDYKVVECPKCKLETEINLINA